MRITLHGGFGERGRIAIGIESRGSHVLLDCGIDTSRTGPDRFPAVTPAELAALDAILVTHAHEDHIAALGWAFAGGFKGRLLMTAEAQTGMTGILAGYAEPGHADLALACPVETLPRQGRLDLGPFRITTGRSGHIVGGVWLHVDDGARSLVHCGDVVPSSPVFAHDPPPPADVLVIDASYGDDPVAWGERAREIRQWLSNNGPRAVLPAPLSGRSIELLALLPAPIAIHAGMRAPLARQIAASTWLRDGVGPDLADRLAAAEDWIEGFPLPAVPLLVHDGMGLAGPSRAALADAAAVGTPVLLTGHVPAGSPAAALRADGKAHWIRLPTHPTLGETVSLVAACRPRLVLGHSADPPVIAALASHIPALRADARTGDSFDIA